MASSELIKLAISIQVDSRSTLLIQDLRSDGSSVGIDSGMFLFIAIIIFLYKGVSDLSILVIIVDTPMMVSYL